MLARQPLPGSTNRMKFKQLATALQDQYGPNAQEINVDHWIFEVLTNGQRSQVVHLLLKEVSASGEDVSRIVTNSPIGPLPPRPDLESLLRRNATLDVGAICIEDFRDDENDLVTYLTLRASHLISTADFAEVWEMIEKVARVADDLEKEIYARDVH
ncbi:MAG TPA: hypothetical protein VKP65_07055 [Rhodothermales bacterium]|nr:hypothetical protein [Rhodothermales bacterium]